MCLSALVLGIQFAVHSFVVAGDVRGGNLGEGVWGEIWGFGWLGGEVVGVGSV